ncbi:MULTISPECIES: hypothetical protein [Cytobacillus]|uniref:Uncharacterized protein n=2 Tax=Cytobacillus TaxID=2675230 RepID=A0AA46Q292_CYTFI|nr:MULTISPECIES: hypothetical protein [Cytobacillus]AND43034.1 hypothetical protein A361_28085 [Cytobacillus oceanisediminis 2691]MCM3244588.1 hypothetical protein [Cytobacillus oceanisediminis]USK47550.1 hypothetical protein LIT27_28860 [Cytobacillus oceanisediminis]UYG98320.1 hypothetical protein OD459_25975 [Cytobacillus firmus]
MEYRDLMNQKGYFYLHSLIEPETNLLRIFVDRCKVSQQVEDIEIGKNIIRDTHPIEVDEELPIIQLDFDSYVSYSIINESFTVLDDYEIFEGESFRIFKKSRYLDFINKGTIANDVFPEEQLVHYEIACLDHIIDVISFDEPIVTEINRNCSSANGAILQ